MNITCTVKRANGYLPEAAQADIESGLRAWLDPNAWDWSPAIEQNAIIGKLYELPSVASVISVNATIPLLGDAPLPTLGTVTVTFA